MYRTEAVQQASRGESYDHPSAVLKIRHWVLLSAIVIAVGASVTWACLAEIPVTVESQGILLYETGIDQVAVVASAEIADVTTVRNAQVRKGDVLLELRLPQLEFELELAQEKLRSLRDSDAEAKQLEQSQLAGETALAQTRRERIQAAIESLSELKQRSGQVRDETVASQRSQVDDLIRESRDRLQQLEAQRASVGDLLRSQLVTETEATSIDGLLLQTQQGIAQLKQQQSTLSLQQVESDQAILELDARIAELKTSLQELDVSVERLRSQQSANQLQRTVQLESQSQLVETLEKQLDRTRQVRAASDGTVLEVPVAIGQPVATGQVVCVLARTPASQQPDLRVAAFFPLRDGKQIQPHHEAFVTPTTVQRERYGSIRASVTEVYAYPMSAQEALRIVGNRELLAPLASSGGVLGIHAELLRRDGDSDQYAWTSSLDPPPLSAGTTVRIQVVVERRRPISYLVPFLYRAFYGPERESHAENVR